MTRTALSAPATMGRSPLIGSLCATYSRNRGGHAVFCLAPAVACTLLRSGRCAGRPCRPGHTTPGRVAVATAPFAAVNAFPFKALTVTPVTSGDKSFRSLTSRYKSI